MIVVIMGPTASGKSRLALETAKQINGEIVSFDSMQVYKGLEIGTAQPTPEERASVPHHLVGICDIHQRLDVYSFTDLAEQCVKDIQARGRVPILAGGTGMYLRSFLYGMDDMPGDRELRAELDALYDAPEKEPALHCRMTEEDPAALEKWKEDVAKWEKSNKTTEAEQIKRLPDRDLLRKRLENEINALYDRLTKALKEENDRLRMENLQLKSELNKQHRA